MNFSRSFSTSLGRLILLPLLLLAGCKSAPTPSSSAVDVTQSTAKDQPTAPVAPKADPATLGDITGTVHFTGKAPARVPIDMSMDPACSLAGENLSEQFMVAGGHLANVYVYVKNAPASKAAPGDPATVLDQKGCRYTPHVIAVQVGGQVEFRNSDPTMHNVHTMPTTVGNETVDVSEGPGTSPQVRRFPAAETMMPVRCNNHPWMNAFLNVAPSPFFAVTGADGSFTIKGLPAGTYTLAAMHEKLGEQETQIVVPAKGTAKADIGFSAR